MRLEEVTIAIVREKPTGEHELREEKFAPQDVNGGADDARVDQVELDPEPLLELVLLRRHRFFAP